MQFYQLRFATGSFDLFPCAGRKAMGPDRHRFRQVALTQDFDKAVFTTNQAMLGHGFRGYIASAGEYIQLA